MYSNLEKLVLSIWDGDVTIDEIDNGDFTPAQLQRADQGAANMIAAGIDYVPWAEDPEWHTLGKIPNAYYAIKLLDEATLGELELSNFKIKL